MTQVQDSKAYMGRSVWLLSMDLLEVTPFQILSLEEISVIILSALLHCMILRISYSKSCIELIDSDWAKTL